MPVSFSGSVKWLSESDDRTTVIGYQLPNSEFGSTSRSLGPEAFLLHKPFNLLVCRTIQKEVKRAYRVPGLPNGRWPLPVSEAC